MTEPLCVHGRSLAWKGAHDACADCLEAAQVGHEADPVMVRTEEGEYPTCRKCGAHAASRLMHIIA